MQIDEEIEILKKMIEKNMPKEEIERQREKLYKLLKNYLNKQ